MKTLFRCVGGGPIDKAKMLFFANELGTAEGGGNTEVTVNKFIADWSSHEVLNVGQGFVPLHIGTLPVNSVFLQCVSRMALAIRHKDNRFFDSLTGEGRAFLNKYILEELYRTETAVINLKPLPCSSENSWEYENISKIKYNKLFNFMLHHQLDNPWKQFRVSILKEAFHLAKKSLILGSGDKHNKKSFLELIFPGIIFQTINITDKIQIYVSEKPRIVLSNYYSPYTGLGLDGLKILYNYMIDKKIV